MVGQLGNQLGTFTLADWFGLLGWATATRCAGAGEHSWSVVCWLAEYQTLPLAFCFSVCVFLLFSMSVLDWWSWDHGASQWSWVAVAWLPDGNKGTWEFSVSDQGWLWARASLSAVCFSIQAAGFRVSDRRWTWWIGTLKQWFSVLNLNERKVTLPVNSLSERLYWCCACVCVCLCGPKPVYTSCSCSVWAGPSGLDIGCSLAELVESDAEALHGAGMGVFQMERWTVDRWPPVQCRMLG